MARVAKKSEAARRPNALEVFTDREHFFSAFDDLIRKKNPDDNNVLVFHGEGGIGKTTLSLKLEQRLLDISPPHLHARLDFKDPDNTVPDYALFRLKERFPAVAFPTFSIALVEYARRVHPEVAFLANRKAFLDGAGPFTDLIEVALDTPGVSLPLKGIKAAAQGSRLLRDWYTRRAEPLLQGLSSCTDEELLELLPELWAKDFHDGLVRQSDPDGFFDEGDTFSLRCPVIFLDTYEMLWRNTLSEEGVLRRMREQWLVTLVGELPEILWVVTGRDRLAWELYDPAWERCCEQHIAGGLSPDDARVFLAKRGITEPEIVSVIVNAACGVPFYLELETQLYDCGVRDPEMFGGTRSEVVERFLGYLDREERATMRLMSSFSSWDDALFGDAVAHFRTGYLANECSAFGQSWSIEQPTPGLWLMHQEMREHLQADLAVDRPDFHLQVHQWGLERFDAQLDGVTASNANLASVHALRSAAVHARVVMTGNKYTDWFWKRYWQVVEQAATWRPLVSVLQAHLEAAQAAHGAGDSEVATCLNNLALLLTDLGRYEEAEPLYRRSLEITEVVHGFDHPEAATTMCNLAILLTDLGRYEEAEPLSRRSLEISSATYGPDHPNVAAALHGLAWIVEATLGPGEAEPLYRRSLDISEATYGPDHPKVGVILNNLGWLLVKQSRYAEAEALFRRSLDIAETASGSPHPSVARALNNLAGLLVKQGRLLEAEPLSARSVTIAQSLLGPDHPDVVIALKNLEWLRGAVATGSTVVESGREHLDAV